MDLGVTAADRQLLRKWVDSQEVAKYLDLAYNGNQDARIKLQRYYDKFAKLFYAPKGTPGPPRVSGAWNSFVRSFLEVWKRVLFIFFLMAFSICSSLPRKPAIDLYDKHNSWTAYFLVSEGLGWLGLVYQLTMLSFPRCSYDWIKVPMYLFAIITLVSECVAFGYLGSVEPNRGYYQDSLVSKCISEGGIHIHNLRLLVQGMLKIPDIAGPSPSRLLSLTHHSITLQNIRYYFSKQGTAMNRFKKKAAAAAATVEKEKAASKWAEAAAAWAVTLRGEPSDPSAAPQHHQRCRRPRPHREGKLKARRAEKRRKAREKEKEEGKEKGKEKEKERPE
ncbi:TPA_exp: Uncharacterized protein A8136_2677 [Trichophyton benhamiae CBS 112371]|uniref:Uncharacterized protein n=1 Tax=Arthroderma benhamiae (strain ATCC MYA-4681 / CBS 112371) TaxID=663331 RepID=D4AL18_ARTBC|nr:uncharacterized protein ARB_05014 [Trichophyton benhamiae CBS 112371]EFE36077.1 hypothetical protein ARB_05014 [Trichophyton benhamiae CBS 112371]DAA78892.1 TPA_exp: Uncharacterized protein A8136_2677 [Trichophyton benhamiae CBS 112371]